MKFILAFAVFTLSIITLTGQNTVDVKVSTEKVNIQGKQYYLHVIQKGETLYAISKAYNVLQKEIAMENPEVFDGLKEGSTLKIPVITNQIINETDKYIYHTVKTGETVYYISRLYGVKEKDIYKINPGSENGISQGQVIKIKKEKETTAVDVPSEDDKFKYHKIEKGQTLYSLSKLYDVPQDDIMKYNPEIASEGLKMDAIIKIPKKQTNAEVISVKDTVKNVLIEQKGDTLILNNKDVGENKDENPCDYDYSKTKERFQIAVFLPFSIDAAAVYNESEEKELKTLKPKPFIEFYQGFLLAVEEIKEKGLLCDIHIFDTRRDSLTVAGILKKEIIDSLDLIIGPVYPEIFKIVAAKADELSIPVVSPFSPNNESVEASKNVYQLVPTFDDQFNVLIDYFTTGYYPHIILLHADNTADSVYAKICKSKLICAIAKNRMGDKIKLTEVSSKTGGINTISQIISKDTINLIIIPSNDQVYVSDILTKLYTKFSKADNICVGGFPSWLKYENIPIEYLHHFQLITFNQYHVDYHDDLTRSFLSEYRNNFETEPSRYSFNGYDLGNYFLNSLYHYGNGFMECPEDTSCKQLQSLYHFARHEENSGIYNRGTFIIKYDREFNIVKLFPYSEIEAIKTE